MDLRRPIDRLSVLIVGIEWPPETFIQRLVRGLLERGVEVTIASARRPDRTWFQSGALSWLHVPSWSAGRAARLFHLTRMAGRAAVHPQCLLNERSRLIGAKGARRDQIKKAYRSLPFLGKRWDVVYFPWNGGAMVFSQLLHSGMPVVISCRGRQINVLPHLAGSERLVGTLRLTFEKAAAVHCVSEAIRDEAIRIGLDPDKAQVIRPAVDPAFFSPGGNRETDGILQVVTTGALSWRKGYEYALLAIRMLLDRGIELNYHIIGDGAERQRVLYTIHDLGIVDRVHLHGRLPTQGVRDRLRTADVFLLPSLSEGLSNAALEAMACGLPVVATDCGGMREAITYGVEGYVVPTRSSESIAVALQELASNQSMRRGMGDAGRRRVMADFRLDEHVSEFVSLFERARNMGAVNV